MNHRQRNHSKRGLSRLGLNIGLGLMVMIPVFVLFMWDHVAERMQHGSTSEKVPARYQESSPIVDEPAIPRQIVDVGYLTPGEVVSLELPFTSPFEECVQVLDCSTTCGCLAVVTHPDELSFEDNAILNVQLDVPERVGFYTQRVKVLTDRQPEGLFEVALHARIGLPLRAEPSELNLSDLSADSAGIAFSVWNDGPEPLRLLYATTEYGRVRVPIEPIPAGESTSLLFEYTHDDHVRETFDINITTAHADQRVLSVPVRAGS